MDDRGAGRDNVAVRAPSLESSVKPNVVVFIEGMSFSSYSDLQHSLLVTDVEAIGSGTDGCKARLQ